MNNTTGRLRVTLTYDIMVDVSTVDGILAWEGAQTVGEARDRYTAWLADGTCDVMIDMDGAPSAIVGVEVLDNE